MSVETYALPSGRTLYRWTNPTGDSWACQEYDHGPFCRLCVPVDATMDACLQHVVDGNFEIVGQVPGEDFHLKVTDKGMREAGHLIDRLVDDSDDAASPA